MYNLKFGMYKLSLETDYICRLMTLILYTGRLNKDGFQV